MALLEILQKEVRRLGLVPRLVRSLPKFSLLLALAGILWLFCLPLDGQYRHTYISENALMPSQAYSFFRESEWNYLRGYRDEVYTTKLKSCEERNQVLDGWLKEIGYTTSVLNYTAPDGTSKPILYAIFHAPKGDDTEAMVIAAPWKVRDGQYNLGGVALGVSMARYFHRLSIWAKNIIVVFPADGQDTLRHWVNSYHTTMDQTGGSILSAVVVEYPSGGDGLDYIDLEYAGLNGQLPNLDLLNTAIMVTQHEGMRASIHHTPQGQLWADDYFSRLTTMLHGIWDYGTTGLLPPPSHGGGDGCEAFSGWNIQAITLTAVGDGTADITTYGRVVEAVFRAVNNLLEKFHQSFFFYLLLGPEAFVSIATYLPAAILTAFSFAIASLSSLLGNHNVSNHQFSSNAVAPANAKGPLVSVLTYIAILAISVLAGLVLVQFSETTAYNTSEPGIYSTLAYYGFILPSTLLAFWPPVSAFVLSLPRTKTTNDAVRFLNAFSLFSFAFTLVGCLVLHFSLSLLISLAALPLTFIRYGPNSDLKTRWKSTLWLLASSPFTWMFILGVFHKTNFTLDRVRNFVQYPSMQLVRQEIQAVIDWAEKADLKAILQGPVDVFYALLSGYPRFQSWTWLFVTISWLPTWLCGVIVAGLDVETSDVKVEEGKKEQ